MKYPIQFGNYLLLERINIGGMAEVFKAKAFGVEGFQRILAIKRILPNMAEEVEFINMFVDEARLAVQLNHANVVQIYELGKQEGQYYIAMEYIAGKDLRKIVDLFRKSATPMPMPLACYICSKVCEGLDYAHRKNDPSGQPLNLIHRDISPQNILVSYEGDIKIIDFGIAKAKDRLAKTQIGVLKGKFAYMSPEQIAGLELDRRSDIFSVGVMLYEMLTGERLFVADSDSATLDNVRNCVIPSLRSKIPSAPEALEQVLSKALAKEREERFQYCSDFNEELQRFLITEQSIFNSKRLSAWMKENFKPEIDEEMSKMQLFMRVGADGEGWDQLASFEDHVGDTLQSSAKTQMFEPGNNALANMQTQVGSLSDIMTQAGQKSGQTANNHSGGFISDSAMTQAVNVDLLRKGLPQNTTSTSGSVSNATVNTAIKSNKSAQKTHRQAILFFIGTTIFAFTVLISAIWYTYIRPKKADGFLLLQVDPATVQSEIYVDNQLLTSGTGPFDKLRIRSGAHTLKLVSKGYASFEQPIELKGGATNILSVTLTPEEHKEAKPTEPTPKPVETPKPAETPTTAAPAPTTPDTTPKPTEKVAEKVVEKQIEKPAPTPQPTPTPSEKVVTPQPQTPAPKTAEVKETPKPAVVKTGSLLIGSEPKGATIVVDGKKVGITPKQITGLELGKIVRVIIKKADYETIRRDVNIKGEEQWTAKLIEIPKEAPKPAADKSKPTPEAKPKESPAEVSTKSPADKTPKANPSDLMKGGKLGSLSVNTPGEPGTRVLVDGRDTQKVTPISGANAIPLPPGTHLVTLVFKDGNKKSVGVKINAGEQYRMLEKK